MLSDAALSIAIGCEIKWLYNSARRLARPVDRSTTAATWWRLVHHLAVGLGVPLTHAARSADTLLVTGMAPGRIRLRATRDDSVAVSIDLARFHDGAALALAAALYLAVPKIRGRPRKRPDLGSVVFSQSEMEVMVRLRALSETERIEYAVESGAVPSHSVQPGAEFLRELLVGGVPFVIVGASAAVFHCSPWPAKSLDLCLDTSMLHAGTVARALNDLGAVPRGIAVPDGFRIDAAILGAVPLLALRVKDMSVNLFPSLGGIGEYAQVEQVSVQVPLGGGRVRVLTVPGLLKSDVPGRIGRSASDRARWLQFAASPDSGAGTP